MRAGPRDTDVAALVEGLASGLDDLGCAALLVLAESARDPELLPFVGPRHLGRSLLIVPRRGVPRLGYLSPMEREEAAATGLATLDPEELEVERLLREAAGSSTQAGALVGAVAVRALALAGLEPGTPPGKPPGTAPGTLALAGHGAAGTLLAAGRALERAGWILRSGDELVLLARKTKPPWQLAEIRRAAAGAVEAFRRVARLLAAAAAPDGSARGDLWLGGERLTVARLRAEVAAELGAARLDQPRDNIVAAGGEGAVPHTAGSDERVLRGGESLVVDLFPAGIAFADCTRTFCVGPPPSALAEAHGLLVDVLARARGAAAPGTAGWQLQEAVCTRLEAAGWQTPLSHPGTTSGYVHNLGHGVGFALQEYPSFRKETGAEGVLATGDVFTLEPGLYDPEAGWAVRVEDLVHLGAEGPEVLTPLPYDLDPRAWNA